jgi:hypothetical protein
VSDNSQLDALQRLLESMQADTKEMVTDAYRSALGLAVLCIEQAVDQAREAELPENVVHIEFWFKHVADALREASANFSLDRGRR